jgi:hypothetical protein
MEKTKIVVFSKRNIPQHDVQTAYGSVQISSTARYLGVILIDSKLNWKAQLASLKQRCQMPLNLIKSVAYVWWGADPSCLLQIYRALVLSKLQSSSFLWQQAAKADLKQLDLIQNAALRKILGAMTSTPIHSMEAATNLPPLHLAAKKEAEITVIKMLQLKNNDTVHKLQELTEETRRQGTTHSVQPCTYKSSLKMDSV